MWSDTKQHVAFSRSTFKSDFEIMSNIVITANKSMYKKRDITP